MTSFKNLSKIFLGVISLFQSPQGMQRCCDSEKAQDILVKYLLILGSLFKILSESSSQLKAEYSEALVHPTIGYYSKALTKLIWNGKWEMSGVNSILISLEVDLCKALMQSTDKFEDLDSLTSWLVLFLENYSFQDKVKEEFGDRCLYELRRIREKLLIVIRASRIEDLKTACQETWI